MDERAASVEERFRKEEDRLLRLINIVRGAGDSAVSTTSLAATKDEEGATALKTSHQNHSLSLTPASSSPSPSSSFSTSRMKLKERRESNQTANNHTFGSTPTRLPQTSSNASSIPSPPFSPTSLSPSSLYSTPSMSHKTTLSSSSNARKEFNSSFYGHVGKEETEHVLKKILQQRMTEANEEMRKFKKDESKMHEELKSKTELLEKLAMWKDVVTEHVTHLIKIVRHLNKNGKNVEGREVPHSGLESSTALMSDNDFAIHICEVLSKLLNHGTPNFPDDINAAITRRKSNSQIYFNATSISEKLDARSRLEYETVPQQEDFHASSNEPPSTSQSSYFSFTRGGPLPNSDSSSLNYPPLLTLSVESALYSLFSLFLLIQSSITSHPLTSPKVSSKAGIEGGVSPRNQMSLSQQHPDTQEWVGKRAFLMTLLILDIFDDKCTVQSATAIFDKIVTSNSQNKPSGKLIARLYYHDFVCALESLAILLKAKANSDKEEDNSSTSSLSDFTTNSNDKSSSQLKERPKFFVTTVNPPPPPPKPVYQITQHAAAPIPPTISSASNDIMKKLLKMITPTLDILQKDRNLLARTVSTMSPVTDGPVFSVLMRYQADIYWAFKRSRNYGVTSRSKYASNTTSDGGTLNNGVNNASHSSFESFCLNYHIIPKLCSHPLVRRISQFAKIFCVDERLKYFFCCFVYIAIAIHNGGTGEKMENECAKGEEDGIAAVVERLCIMVKAQMIE